MRALLPTSRYAEAGSVGLKSLPRSTLAALWRTAPGRPRDDRPTCAAAGRGTAGGPAQPAWGRRGDSPQAVTLLRHLDSYDRAAYQSVAQLRLPLLDEPLRLVSDVANFSKPWFLISGLLAPVRRKSGLACRPHRGCLRRRSTMNAGLAARPQPSRARSPHLSLNLWDAPVSSSGIGSIEGGLRRGGRRARAFRERFWRW